MGADAGGSGNALEVVMGIWIERQLEFVGSYRINLATTALVQLLACRHPALMALQVLPPLPQLFPLSCSAATCTPTAVTGLWTAGQQRRLSCCHCCGVPADLAQLSNTMWPDIVAYEY